MQSIIDRIKQSELTLRISADDFERFLKSLQTLSCLKIGNLLEGISFSEMSLIHIVIEYPQKHDGEPVTVVQASEELNISVPAVSRTLRGLVAKNILRRLSDDNDRRVVKIAPTENCEEIIKVNFRKLISIVDMALSGFSDDEISSAVDIYCRLSEAMQSAVQTVQESMEQQV